MKNIIITGGHGGIGKQISQKFIEQGFSVISVGRNRETFNKAFFKFNSTQVKFYELDISSSSGIDTFYQYLLDNLTSIDCLINAAGAQAPIGPFSSIEFENWSNNVQTNLIGVARILKCVIPFFIKAQRGKIINFSGGGATSSRPNFSAYAVSKIAVVRLTEILSDELKINNVDINAVAPGPINTAMLDEVLMAGELAGEELRVAQDRKICGGISPEKVANLCLFLASEKSNGITGKLISAVWDDYNNPKFINRLKNDKDFCTLRRIDGRNYNKII